VAVALTSDGEEQFVHITQQNWYMQVNNYDTSLNVEKLIAITIPYQNIRQDNQTCIKMSHLGQIKSGLL